MLHAHQWKLLKAILWDIEIPSFRSRTHLLLEQLYMYTSIIKQIFQNASAFIHLNFKTNSFMSLYKTLTYFY